MTKIPHLGLQTLERLRIQNTHSLKTIPSLLNFRDLQEAFLTHSFHCCAYKYPARHDPSYYTERQRLKEIIQKKCSESSTKASQTVTQAYNNDGWGDPVNVMGGDGVWESRKKRRRAIEEDLRYKFIPKMYVRHAIVR